MSSNTDDRVAGAHSELDALRAENERLQDLLDHAVEVMNDGTVGAGFILAENKRLRAALEEIRDSTEDVVYVKAVARDALESPR